MKIFPSIFSMILLVIVSNEAHAYANPPVDIAREISLSDEVVVGKVLSIVNGSDNIFVQESFKSKKIFAGSIIRLTSPATPKTALPGYDPSITLSGIELNDRRVFFLKNSKNSFVPADPAYPSILINDNAVSTYNDPMSWITDCLASKLVTDASTTGMIRSTFDQGLINSQSDNRRKTFALQLITPFVSQRILMSKLAVVQSPIAKLWLVTAIMNIHQMNGLAEAAAIFPKNYASYGLVANQSFLMALYGLKLNDQKKAPMLAKALKPLLEMNKTAINQSVYEALRQNPSAEGVPMLSRGIDSSDLATRYLAVSGLAKTTGAGPEWTFEGYNENKTQVDQFWINWRKFNK